MSDSGDEWPVDVTLPGGQTVRAQLVGQRRDETTGAWVCRVELEVWGPDRPVTEDPERPGEYGQLVHYYDCPADPADALVIPPTYLYEPSRQYRPCPACRPPLPLPRAEPRISVDVLPDRHLPPPQPGSGESRRTPARGTAGEV